MQNRVEPPVLISRLMAFVLATALVVLATLGYTIYSMFPLNRPQVFFLTSTVRADQDIYLTEMQPKSANFDAYKRAFIREYIRHRNEIYTNASVMHEKWNADNGAVHVMSTDDVYSEFAKTTMFTALMSGMPDFDFKCPVVFVGDLEHNPAYMASEDTYRVKFRYFCADNTGRTWPKDYTISIKLETQGETPLKWTERITNPLGLRVAEYKIVEGDGDPLDTGFRETTQEQ